MVRRFFIWSALFMVCASSCAKKDAPQQSNSSVQNKNAQSSRMSGAFARQKDIERLLQNKLNGDPELLSMRSVRTEWTDEESALLEPLYATRLDTMIWASPGSKSGLTDAGHLLWTALERAESEHAIFLESLGASQIQTLLRQADFSKLPDASMRRAFVKTALRKLGSEVSPEGVLTAMLQHNGPTPELARIYDMALKAQSERAKHAFVLERAMMRALIRYISLLRVDHDSWARHMTWPNDLVDFESAVLKALDRKERLAKLRQLKNDRRVYRLKHWLEPVFKQPLQISKLLQKIEPPFVQYANLKLAFLRYSKLLNEGGWRRLDAQVQKLKPGDAGQLVLSLRDRLMAEGYLDKKQSALSFDNVLTEAIKRYQRAHQIWVKGVVTPETWRSLNVSVERRWHQIALSLRRWRQSPMGQDTHYIYTNIADFHAEVWFEGQRKMRFPVVAGSAKRFWERDGVKQPLATKLFSDEMTHIVFNPYWNVPDSILHGELEQKFEENPTYFEEQGYEWFTDAGKKRLRQKPGPANALGQVKFLFPNKHSIYMHDTPDKGWFEYPIRAFSHGCVRVSRPMELAQYLLAREGRWVKKKVDGWLKGPGEVWISLKEAVPVHIDSIIVRADRQGQPFFLADVYRREHRPQTLRQGTWRAVGVHRRAVAHALGTRPLAEPKRL